MIRKKRRS